MNSISFLHAQLTVALGAKYASLFQDVFIVSEFIQVPTVYELCNSLHNKSRSFCYS